jgi:hypothetical protein
VHSGRHLAKGREPLEEGFRLARDLFERQLPPARAVAEEALHDGERGRERVALVLRPAVERRDVLKRVRGQEAHHLELGVEPGLELAEQLRHDPLAEHE